MLLIGGDPSELEKPGQTTENALNIVGNYYEVYGIPANLSPEDRAALMGYIDNLYCTLSNNPPLGVDPVTIVAFLKDLQRMWIDLGGQLNDLGC